MSILEQTASTLREYHLTFRRIIYLFHV